MRVLSRCCLPLCELWFFTLYFTAREDLLLKVHCQQSQHGSIKSVRSQFVANNYMSFLLFLNAMIEGIILLLC
jgi:hypothetical protein